MVSDKHRGIESAVAKDSHGVLWQRCQVHLKRNVCGKAEGQSVGHRAFLGGHGGTDARGGRGALARVVEELSPRYPEVALLLEEQGEEMLAAYALPAEHRKRMSAVRRMLERWFEEVRRRTRVVRVFPNRASCVRLIGAHCLETNEEWLQRRYLRMEPDRSDERLVG